LKFELVILDNLSGGRTTLLSPILEGHELTLFEHFVAANKKNFAREVINLELRLEVVGKETGLMEEFFKTGAGRLGQNICTFKDRPRSLLRLYFIEFGNFAIILGGGGPKPKSIQTSQEVPVLANALNILGLIADTLRMAEKKGHFGFDEDGNMFSTTDYIYDSEDYVQPPKNNK